MKKPKADKSAVGKLTEKLYSKNSVINEYERKRFLRKKADIADDWGIENSERFGNKDKKKRQRMTAFTKALILSFVFLVVSFSIAVAVFLTGQNSLTYDNVTLSVLGPNAVSGGEVLSFDVAVANQNPVDIELSDIIIDYPSGSFDSFESGVSIGKIIEATDTVASGSQVSKKFQAVLFGQEGETKDIRITFEYRIPGSNRLFFKERIYQVRMESSPVEIRTNHAESILSGESVELEVEVISNSNKTVNNLLVEIEYPFGFTFASSSEEFLSGENLFVVGDLAPGSSKTFTVNGTLSGQDDEARVFRYRLGSAANEAVAISQIFVFSESEILIEKPPIRLATEIENKPDQITTTLAGDTVNVDISFTNNLSSTIEDPVITAQLSGYFDERSVSTQGGFYNSGQNTITWNQNDTDALKNVVGAETSSVSFSFSTQDTNDLAGFVVNPEIGIAIEMTGQSFGFDEQIKNLRTNETKKIKLETEGSFRSGVFHSLGPVENSGPAQPTVEQESTYTILWRLENSINQLEDVSVKAVLPAYVTYRGIYDPEGVHDVTFDARSREIEWKISEVVAGAGYDKDPAELYFQLGLTPSVNQEGRDIIFVEEKQIRATDSFTKTIIEYTGPEESTNQLSRDPAVGSDTKVQGQL